jgi:hypothetical protein
MGTLPTVAPSKAPSSGGVTTPFDINRDSGSLPSHTNTARSSDGDGNKLWVWILRKSCQLAAAHVTNPMLCSGHRHGASARASCPWPLVLQPIQPPRGPS